jgi:hypothetical protein
MVSYGRDTDDDEVHRPKEWTVMGRKTRSSVYTLYVRNSNKEKLSISFDRSWGFEGYGYGSRR